MKLLYGLIMSNISTHIFKAYLNQLSLFNNSNNVLQINNSLQEDLETLSSNCTFYATVFI